MFSKESLYINAIKYKAQLKINYKKLQNDTIAETNNSLFIAKDDILSKDIAIKLNNHSSEIDNTYISTLLLQDETELTKKTDFKIKDFEYTSLNNDYDICVSKNTLFETKNYFDKCGIDYIFSAYHVLNLHIEQNPCQNNLVILLFNNQAFCIILNSKSDIVFNKRIELTPFENIKDSRFYENDILGQKLFDEIYYLELNEAIKNTIEEFYKNSKNIFIEKVSLLYNLKQISEEQINSMSESYMIDISYSPLSVEEELFELSKDTHVHKSFIKPRIKPNNNFKNIFITIFSLALILGLFYVFINYEDIIKNEKIEEKKIENIIDNSINLPNHILKNDSIERRVLKPLEVLPYDVVLKELHIEKNSIKMYANLLSKDTYIKVIQAKLLEDYNSSIIDFKNDNSLILDGIISAEGFKNNYISEFKNYNDTYVKNEFMPIITVTEQIKMLFPKDTIVTFKSSFKSEVLTFNYLINVIIQTPLSFFEIINTLNNELYSINISYPISFVKTEAGIEVEFILQFHQNK